MKVCYLPIKSLRPNPNNFLIPLTDEEYAQLRESIVKFGVLEPLIVVPEANGMHTIYAGNHRYQIALEIGLKELQCIVVDKTMIEGVFDTEIFRRHLTKEQKEQFRSIKEEVCKEIIDKLLKEKLLPELFNKYKAGELDRKVACSLIELPQEDQAMLYKVSRGSEVVDLEEIIEEKDAQIKRLRESKKELKEKLEEYEEEITKLKGLWMEAEKSVNEALKKEYEQELQRREDIREELVRQLREKEEEIEKIKEQRSVEEKKRHSEEIEKKSMNILKLEKQKKYMVNIVLHCLDEALENIENARKRSTESEMPSKDVSLAREKIRNIIEKSRGLLTLIRIEGRGEEKGSLFDIYLGRKNNVQ